MHSSVKLCSMFRGKRSNKMVSVVKEVPAVGKIEPYIIESGKEAATTLGEQVRFRGWFEIEADNVLEA